MCYISWEFCFVPKTRQNSHGPQKFEFFFRTFLSALLIRGGTLTWDTDVDGIHLQAEYVIIVNGEFHIGTEAEPMLLEAKMTIYGPHRSIPLPIYGAKVFAVRSGKVEIHGAPVVPTWTFLEETADPGANSIRIQTPDGLQGWNVGDRIAIAPTGGMHSIIESEDVLITAEFEQTYLL